jgi:5-methyltetrahydrofolate--homocysteine methyltransferase
VARALPGEAFQVLQEDVLRGDHDGIRTHVREMLGKGCDAQEILQKGMIAAMEVVGERFKNGEVFIPEVLLSARAMNEALLVLEPHLAGEKSEARGKILIGTVHGDLHDIGKNMVVTMLRGVGFEIKDLGINVATEAFVREVGAYRPDVLGLSALLTTTMPEMGKVIEALKQAGLREKVKVIVGGAPVNVKFAKDIGAEGYAADAGEAVSLVKDLLPKSV